MCKDSSVVSRNLQRLAENLPVLAKIRGKWHITPLGKKINSIKRNNLEAEANIVRLIGHWRKAQKPIAHIKHISDNPQSLFFRESNGANFITSLGPTSEELVIEKKKSSAFQETSLAEEIVKRKIETLVLVGFTANECIDATARDSSGMGMATFVVSDATAMFDFDGPDGKLVKAARIHNLTMANLNLLYAKVVNTEYLLQTL